MTLAIALVLVLLSPAVSAMINLEEDTSVGVTVDGSRLERGQNRMQVMTLDGEGDGEGEQNRMSFRQQLEEKKMSMEKRKEMIQEKRKEMVSKIAEKTNTRVQSQVNKLDKVKDWSTNSQERLENRINQIGDEALRTAAEEKKDALLITKDEVTNIIAELSNQRELLASLKEDENWEALQPALEVYKAELQKFKQALNMGIGQAKNMYKSIK